MDVLPTPVEPAVVIAEVNLNEELKTNPVGPFQRFSTLSLTI